MFSPKHIVVPTDYSFCSEHALENAIDIAECYNAKLHLIHVIINEIEQMPYLLLSNDKIADLSMKIKDNATKEMNFLVSKYLKDRRVNYETYITEGTPYQEILKFSDEIKADLIVISPKGKSALEGFFFGSTTDKVVHKAQCSVLVSKYSK